MLSCDNFTTAYIVALLLFSAPYIVERCGVLALAFMPLALLLPFAVMPVFYSLIHRFSPLMFGRYHLVMPVTGMASALFYVMLWSSDGVGASGACLAFFGMLAFIEALLVYKYCSFSVRTRLGGEGVDKTSIPSIGFALLGAAAALSTQYGFYFYDKATMYLNAAYIVGAATVILSLVQYFATYTEIPRLGGRRVQSIKSVFKTFYVGLNRRTYLSSMFYMTAFVTVAALGAYFAYAGGGSRLSVSVTCAFIAAYAAVFAVTSVKLKRRSVGLSVAVTVILALSSIAFGLAMLDLGAEARTALCVIGAALVGGGGALCFRQMRMRFVSIKSRATVGTVYLLIELTVCAAAAIALVVLVICYGAGLRNGALVGFAYGFGAGGLFAVVGLALSCKLIPKSSVLPELSYELDAGDLQELEDEEEREKNRARNSEPREAQEGDTTETKEDAEREAAGDAAQPEEDNGSAADGADEKQ